MIEQPPPPPESSPTVRRSPDDSLPSKESFAKRVLIAASLTIGLFAGVMLLWYAVQVLLIVFAGILVAILLRQCAIFAANHSRLSEQWALAAIVLLIAIFSSGVGYLLAPRIAEQGQQLYQTLPKAYDQAKGWAENYPLGRAVINALPTSLGPAGGHGNLLGNLTGAASVTLSAALTLVLILFLGMYLAAEPDLYIDGFTRLFSHSYRDHVRKLMCAVGTALAGWLVGQGIDMAFIGVLTAAGLWMIGVPLAITLGLLAALANFIPNFGPFIAFVPSALLALTINPHKIWLVLILFLVVQGIEGYILQPTIQRRTVSLPPALTILAQVLLGLLLGPMGVVLATPLMASAMVLVKVLYVRDVLHDPVKVEGAPPVPPEKRAAPHAGA